MSKIRVYELARDLKVDSKTLVTRIKALGIDVASHQSTLTGEQIQKIRKAVSQAGPAVGESPVEEAPKETAAASTKTVIRRRRSEGEAPGEVPKAPEAAPPQTVIRRPRTEEAAPSLAATSEEDVGYRPESASEAGHATASTGSGSDEGAELRAAEQAEAAGEREPPTPARPSTTVNRSEASGGATIVRRASPEELRAAASRSQQGQAPQSQPSGGFRPGRPPQFRDDQRGDRGGAPGAPRPGFQSRPPDRGPAPGGARSAVDMSSYMADVGWKDERDRTKVPEKKKVGFTDTSEEALLKKAAALKERRDHINTRVLLSQIDLGDEEEVDTEEASRKRTYAPTVGTRKRDLKRRKDLKKTQVTVPRAAYRVVKMEDEITVGELARQLSVKAGELIKKLIQQGMMVTINQSIDFDTATLIAQEYNFEVQNVSVDVQDILAKSRAVDKDAATRSERPPIVTVMGHVDHGKTSILDAIRKTTVAAGEAGGITQHIGAYTVNRHGKKIAFLDTPGHEAFSSMRARGAKLTDIVVLVVAADDGVMPQTVEAISHAKAAGVPIIVAINKIDKPITNLERIFSELMEYGIQSEEWGGETQFVKMSALQKIGIDELLDAILLQAEVLELKAPVDVPAHGVVVEAHLDKGRGPVATIMVQEGTLNIGDCIVAGTAFGKVRAMIDHEGHSVKEAGPSTPVEVIGLAEVPMAGDDATAVEDEKVAKEVAEWRMDKVRKSATKRSPTTTLDELLGKIQQQETPEVPVIIKGDTQGSVEAIAEAIAKINTEKVRNRVVHKAVGGVNESDISLAQASGAIIIAFNVRAARGLDDMAEKGGVPISYFSIIYDVVDAVKSVMAGKLPPILKEVVLGHAEVRTAIKVPKIGVIAGSAVTDGKVTRNSHLRVIRDQVVVFAGRVGSLRRFKDDVREVMQGYECGISIDGYNDVRPGDVIESYVIEEQTAVL